MKLTGIRCHACGAPLQIDARATIHTCPHCGSHQTTDSAANDASASELTTLREEAGRMAEELRRLRLQRELDQLDREWDRQREAMLVRGRDGRLGTPMLWMPGVIGGIAVSFGLVWMLLLSTRSAPLPMTLFGLLFAGLGATGAARAIRQSNAYAELLQNHETRRAGILIRMKEDRP